MYHYSAKTGGFCLTSAKADYEKKGSWPTDAVGGITQAQRDALSDGERDGKRIVPDATGYPVLVDAPKPTASDVWDQIKLERDRRKSGGFGVKIGSQDKWFHSDVDSRIQHLALKDKARDLLAGGGAMADKLTLLGQVVKWKTMDGSFVEISAQVAFDIVTAAADLDAQLFAVAENHKAAMEASADPSGYDFSAGWPESFQAG